MINKKVWSFNIGEWTEAYVFLKLLGVGRVYGTDANNVLSTKIYMDVLEILRFEESKELSYRREDGRINCYENGAKFYFVPAPDLLEKANYLYNKIKAHKKATMSEPLIQEFMEHMHVFSPKTTIIPPNYQKIYGNKSDIIIKTGSSLDHSVSTDGFSIKSHIGSNATLFNCSNSSRMIYEVVNCTDYEMHRINSCERFVDKYKKSANGLSSLNEEGMIGYIKRHNSLSLRFIGAGSETFESNMLLTDSCMLEILSNLLLILVGYIGNLTSSSSEDLSMELERLNPMSIRKPEYYYQTKIKQFHFNSFAGMTASTEWDGRPRLTGGYIDVDKDGNILYYRATSNDVFINYLFKNVYFDRPDRGVLKDLAIANAHSFLNTGKVLTKSEEMKILYSDKGAKRPKKGDWGYVYKDQNHNRYLMAINFQTRFR